MEDILETYGVPDIPGDGIANAFIINNVMRFCFWQWERSPGGVLRKVCTAKIRITREGMVASRPMVTDILSGRGLSASLPSEELMTAH